jgi:hypothetical protein
MYHSGKGNILRGEEDEVLCIYRYEDKIRKLTKPCLNERGRGREGMGR